MVLTRSPGPIPALDSPPSEGNIAAVNRFLSRLGAGIAAQNANSAVEIVALATLGNTTGDSGSYSGSIAFAGSNNVTASLSSGSNRQATLVVSGPTLMSLGASTGGNTLGTTGLVASRVVLVGSQNVTLSESISGQSATVTILGPANLMSAGMSTNGNTAGTTGYATHRLNLVGGDAITLSGSTDAGSMSITLVGRTDWASSNHSHGNPTLALTGVSGTTASASNGLTLSLAVKTDWASSNHSHGNPTLALTNLSGTTASNSAGLTLSLSAANPGAGGGIAASAGTQEATSGTVVFANSNGVSWGMSDSSQITATVKTDYLTTAALSNHSHGDPTLALTNINGTTASNSAGLTLSLSVAPAVTRGNAPLDVAVATASGTATSQFAMIDHQHRGVFRIQGSGNTGDIDHNITLYGSVGIHAGNNISISSSGTNNSHGTLIIHAANPGGGVSISEWCPYPEMSLITASSLVQNSIYFNPIDLQENVSAYRANFFASIGTTWNAAGNNTRSAGLTLSFCLYTRGSGTNSTRLESLLSRSAFINLSGSSVSRVSVTHPFGISDSTAVSTSEYGSNATNASTYLVNSVAGGRVIFFPVSSALTPGRYWMAVANSTTSANASVALGISVVQQQHGSNIAFMPFGTSSKATNASWPQVFPGRGVYSATSGAFPATVNMITDHIRQLATTVNLPFFNLSAYTTATNIL